MKKQIPTYNDFLNESPDILRKDGKKFGHHSELDAMPFGYYKKEFKILNYPMFHGNTLANRMFPEIERRDFEYAGRLWKNKKIISFWFYPENQKTLRKIAKDIKKSVGVDIYSGGWLIDIQIDRKNKKEYTLKIGKNLKTFDEFQIPIEDYKIKSIRSKFELEQNHALSPLKKSKGKVPRNIGSKKGGQTKKFQKIYTSEMKNNNFSFDEFLKELKLNES